LASAPKLLSLLAEGEARQAIEAAIEQQAWDQMLTLSRRYPGQFSCSQIHHLWALADAHHARSQSQSLLAVYERIIPGCKKAADRLVTLQRAQGQLSPEAMEALIQREALVTKDEEAQKQFTEIRYAFYTSRLSAAFQDNAADTVFFYEEQIRAEVLDKRDVDIALLLGWSHFHAQQLAQATEWFSQAVTWDARREDAAYGLALTRFRQRNFHEAETLARRWADTSQQMRSLLGEVLLARARESRERKEFRESLTLIQESEQYRTPQRDANLLKAWNLYDLGETARAAEEFAVLYRSQPDEETAQGVFYSYAREQDWKNLKSIVESTSDLSRHCGQLTRGNVRMITNYSFLLSKRRRRGFPNYAILRLQPSRLV